MKKPKMAVVGSLNMDLVLSLERLPVIGETLLGKEIHYISGGKGANQAVGSARLGAEVIMIGAVGDDMFGTQIISRMEQFGVNTSAIAMKQDTPTGTATILHTEEDNCIVIIPGANELCDSDMVEAHADAIRSADILLVQLEIPLPAVERAMRIAASAGVTIVLNPAPALPLAEELIGLADIFTPNETEFAHYSGTSCESEEELIRQMGNWQERYGKTLIVTRGESGVSCINKDGLIHVPARKVKPVDTTGAGDCFNAAFGFAIASGRELEASLNFAVKAASLSVTKFGAQDGMPSLDEVEGA
ncbi:ribokinase [Paenibacillus nasutitermitis]|uniref:Ribokinase n=1 Tax=Paenibacillus nasutitermitis TaxID=1652958 RepID=A0A916Z8L2_9BACL|nr:ribokinase [Paenibacillus nasutitermitis]GGD81513.1 ribokinase [Paenibacillus nasutitermitis]